MAEDFKLTGRLYLQGVAGLPKIVNEIAHTLRSLPAVKIGGVEQLAPQFEKATRGAKGFQNQLHANATSLQDFSDKAALALRRFSAFSIAATAVYGGGRLFLGGIKNAALFERELVKVRQVSGATANSIATLREEISRLGQSLAAPASELANVSVIISQAGFSLTETKTIIEALARTRLSATFGNIESTAKGAIAIMGQFGIKVEELSEALGITNAVSARFSVESEELISAVRRAGGVFAATSKGLDSSNVSLAKFYALFTSVSDVTRQAPESIATGLRTIFARLERPKTIKYFKDLGIELTDFEGKFIGPFNAIQKLSRALEVLDTRDLRFIEAAEVIGGNRQLGITIPLLKGATLQQEAFNVAISDSKKFLTDAALPLENLKVKFEQLTNLWADFTRDIYNSNTFQFLGNEAISLARAITKVADSLAEVIPIFAAIGAIKLGAGIAHEGAAGFFINRLRTGHGLTGRQSGGRVGGTGFGDKELIAAEPGEFVLRRRAANKLGMEALQALNNIDRFNMGGRVGRRRLGYTHGGSILSPKKGKFYRSFIDPSEVAGDDRSYSKDLSYYEGDFLLAEGSGKGTDIPHHKGAVRGQFHPEQFYYNPEFFVKEAERKETISRLKELRQRYPTAKISRVQQFEDEKGEFRYRNIPHGEYAKYIPNSPSLRGSIGGGVELGDFRNIQDVSNFYIKEAKKAGLSFSDISKNLKEVENAAKTLPEAIKLLKGSLQAASYDIERSGLKGGGTSGGALAPILLGALYNRSISSPSGQLVPVGGSGRGILQGPQINLGSPRRLIQQQQQLLLTDQRIKDPNLIANEVGFGGAGQYSTSTYYSPAQQAALYQAAAYARGGGGSVPPYIPGGPYGPVPPEKPPLSGSAARRAEILRIHKLIGRKGTIGRGVFDFGKGAFLNADPTKLAIAAVGSQYLLPNLGVSEKATSITSSTLAGAAGGAYAGGAIGSFFGPGGTAIGAGVGALGGGAIGFFTAFLDDSAEQLKKLEESTKKLNLAFIEAEKNTTTTNNLQPLLAERNAAIQTTISGAGGGFDFRQIFGGSRNIEKLKRDEAQTQAESNATFAGQEQQRIKSLVRSGKISEITAEDLKAAISNNANLLLRPERTQIIEALNAFVRSEIINKANEDNLTSSITSVEDFAKRVGRATSALDLFSDALKVNIGDVDNAFNEALGNFTLNKTFTNPFENIDALSKGQLEDAFKSIENVFGPNAIPRELKNLGRSIPILQNFSGILNEEILKSPRRAAGDNLKNLVQRLVNTDVDTNQFSTLPQVAKNALSDVFETLEEIDIRNLVGGKNPELLNQIDDILQGSLSGSVDALKKLQDNANDVSKAFLDIANKRSQLIGNFFQKGAERQDFLANFLVTRNQIQGRETDPRLQTNLELNSVRALTGGIIDPVQILGRINALTEDRKSIDPLNIVALSENKAALDAATLGLDKLSKSAIGLSAIQTKLSEVLGREGGFTSSIIQDSLGGNQQSRLRGEAAFKIFNQTKNLGAVAGAGLAPEDLLQGFERNLNRLKFLGADEETLRETQVGFARDLIKSDIATGRIAPEAGARDLAQIDQFQAIAADLRIQGDLALYRQGAALKAQTELFGAGIDQFDEVVTNNFLVGVSNLTRSLENFIPEITLTAKHEHNVNVNGVDFLRQLDPYIRKVGEEMINKAFSKITNGQEKKATRAPAMDAAYF